MLLPCTHFTLGSVDQQNSRPMQEKRKNRLRRSIQVSKSYDGKMMWIRASQNFWCICLTQGRLTLAWGVEQGTDLSSDEDTDTTA